MKDFDLDRALNEWRRQTIAVSAPEAEDLAELEAGLLDRHDEYLLRGYSPAEAWELAMTRVNGTSPGTVAGKSGNAFDPALLLNYFKVAGRNLRNRGWFNLVNFLSLTIGIVVATIAVLYLHYETTYDASIPDAERKYRVGQNLRSQGYSMISFPSFYSSEAPEQQRQVDNFAAVPGVRSALQFITFPEPTQLGLNERKLIVEDLLQTNTPARFLDYFGFRLVAGDPTAFSTQPYTALLTEGEAERFYGAGWRENSPVGQTLRIDTVNYTVAGVVADPAPNLHFDYSVALHRPRIDYWGSRTYLELEPGAEPAVVTDWINANLDRINTAKANDELFGGYLIQPLRSIHLGSDLLYELKPPGDVRYLIIIGLIALVILLLTISNYTNLAVVMNVGRAREIGMRKVFGASRSQVAGQFLAEAVLLSLLTLPVVGLALWYVLPRFNQLMGTVITPELLTDVLPALLGLGLLVGLLAGLYPAWYLARTQVQGLLKGRLGGDAGGGVSTRNVVVTLQFVLLIGLCSLTLFVHRQLRYIQEKDLGYDRSELLYVAVNADSSRFATFRNEVLRLPGITEVGSGSPMGQDPYNQLTYRLAGTDETFDDAYNIDLDYRAIRQLGVQTSIPELVNDPTRAPARLVLINRTLADRLNNRFGLTDAELLGKTIVQEPEYVDEETGQVGFPYVVGGTFADVHLFSLREKVDPMFLTVTREPRYAYWASISFAGRPPREVLSDVRERYDALGFNQLFTHAFLTDNLAELYLEEQRISTLSTWFSVLAFVMAIIGLAALTAYLTSRRQKEIGIRKILGAGNGDILRRFNLEYLPLLVVAGTIAIPVAWWGSNRWLERFAYRISPDAGTFALALLIVIFVTGLAISLVALRAARAVPASVLTRNE